eukprot:474038-Prorocentrum_minimum.AAC.2
MTTSFKSVHNRLKSSSSTPRVSTNSSTTLISRKHPALRTGVPDVIVTNITVPRRRKLQRAGAARGPLGLRPQGGGGGLVTRVPLPARAGVRGEGGHARPPQPPAPRAGSLVGSLRRERRRALQHEGELSEDRPVV